MKSSGSVLDTINLQGSHINNSRDEPLVFSSLIWTSLHDRSVLELTRWTRKSTLVEKCSILSQFLKNLRQHYHFQLLFAVGQFSPTMSKFVTCLFSNFQSVFHQQSCVRLHAIAKKGIFHIFFCSAEVDWWFWESIFVHSLYPSTLCCHCSTTQVCTCYSLYKIFVHLLK